MKVCMILLDSFKYDNRTYKECIVLGKNGYEVVVLGIKDSDTPESEEFELFKVRRIKVNSRYLGKNKVTLLIKIMEYFLKSCLQSIRERANFYHCHNAESLLIGYIASRINRSKLIYDSRELFLDKYGYKFIPKFFKYIFYLYERFFIGRVDAVIDVNENRANVLISRYKISKPIVISNFPFYDRYINTNKIRRVLGLNNLQKIVLYSGAIREDRGIKVLIESAKLINKDTVIVFMGDGEVEKFMKLIRELNLENKVFFIPPVTPGEIYEYIVSADIGVCLIENVSLNNYLGTPSKLFDYLICGVPVIAGGFLGAKEWVEKNEVGKVVDPNNPIEIANAINEILNNPSMINKFKENALFLAKNKYNWDIESCKLLSLYKRLENEKYK